MPNIHCTVCGGSLQHLITDVVGRRVYICREGLTRGSRLDRKSGRLEATFISDCGHVQDEYGRNIPDGTLSYFTFEEDEKGKEKKVIGHVRFENSRERL